MAEEVEKRNQEANLIAKACKFLEEGNIASAKAVILEEYKFEPIDPSKRTTDIVKITRTFLRNGAIDCYTGQRLVFTPALRILSESLGQDSEGKDIMPYHINWKMNATHQAYWNLAPTLDHIDPIAWHGSDSDNSNLVCCTQLTNSQKGSWTLKQLGWNLHAPGDLLEWDGLFVWFMKYYKNHPDLKNIRYFKDWYRAAHSAVKEEASWIYEVHPELR